MIFSFIFLVALAVGVVWLVRAMPQGGWQAQHRSTGLDLLEERYAKGEINRDEYLEKKRDMAK